MPRKTRVFECDDMLAIVIPKQYAKKIDLKAGDSVKIALNSMNSVMVEKVACLPK